VFDSDPRLQRKRCLGKHRRLCRVTFTGRSHHADNSQAPLRKGQRTGAPRRPPLSATFKTATEAKAWTRKVEGDIDQGKHYGLSRVRTLADAIDAFTKRTTTIKTADDRNRHLAWWRAAYGNRKLFHSNGDVVEDGRETLAGENIEPNPKKPVRHRAPQTVRHYLVSLPACMDYAKRKKRWIEKNPVSDVDPCSRVTQNRPFANCRAKLVPAAKCRFCTLRDVTFH